MPIIDTMRCVSSFHCQKVYLVYISLPVWMHVYRYSINASAPMNYIFIEFYTISRFYVALYLLSYCIFHFSCAGYIYIYMYIRICIYILVWTQRVKPGFMHALGNSSLYITLSEGANRRAANRVSWIPRSGWIPGARCLDFSVAPVLVVWTP